MKNYINKTIAFLFALILIASIATTSYNTVFVYTDESDIIAPVWEEEVEVENDNRD